MKSRPSEIQLALEELEKEDVIFKFDEFYFLRNDYSLIEKRRTANARALKQMELARKKAAIISKFPFIRGIFVLGSLSKNYADDKSDLDFFVVTTPELSDGMVKQLKSKIEHFGFHQKLTVHQGSYENLQKVTGKFIMCFLILVVLIVRMT